MNRKNLWDSYTDKEKKEIEEISKEYKEFLDNGKTEREVIENTLKILKKSGFKDIESLKALKAGDKIYYNNRNKNLLISIIGKEKITKGVNMVVSHVDSPRLDLKMNPFIEDEEFLILNTHYYGGIKKYQWVATPLSIHGVVILKNGKKVDLVIGEKDDDPVFCIPDILPHLSANIQDGRKAREVIKGEELKVLFASKPVENEDAKQKIKANILAELKKQYKIEEDDFFSAEIEIVPALKARDIGFDRGMIGAYGQDDRICAYTSLKAVMEVTNPEKTTLCYLTDKEEIGSDGSTGLKSNLIEYFIGKLIKLKEKSYDDLALKETLWNSKAISADVTAGMDPIFKSVHDPNNVARLSHGIAVAKYTGSRGKSGSNDADAEFLQEIREVFNKNNVAFQAGGFGKVDEGGGGTVAKLLAFFGIRTVDAGPALLSMHSLFEVSSKADIYESYKAYKAFCRIK